MAVSKVVVLALVGLTSGQNAANGAVACTANGQDCSVSKCCSEQGMTCFKKNDHWSSCNETCDPYKYWNTTTNQFEVSEEQQWVCDVLSAAVACTANGQDCSASKCCSEQGMTCFEKNEHWASCNETCDPYKFWNTTTNQFEVHEDPQWTCRVLSQAANETANETITLTGTATATTTAAGNGALPGTGTPGASMPNNVAAAKAAQAETQAVSGLLLNSYERRKDVSPRVSTWSLAGTSVFAVMLLTLVVGVNTWRSSRSASSLVEPNMDEVAPLNE